MNVSKLNIKNIKQVYNKKLREQPTSKMALLTTCLYFKLSKSFVYNVIAGRINIPFGKKLDKKTGKLVDHKTEQRAIEIVKELHKNGLSYSKILKELRPLVDYKEVRC